MDEFLAAMHATLPEGGRVLGCQFRGDPNSDIYGKWRARVINHTSQLDPAANVYLCVSAMRRNDRGEFRRRKENFAGGLLLMIDDIGSGPGSKFPMSVIDPLPPTALIETSPGNHQAVYFFREAVTDAALFDALIRAFITRQFLGRDTGQAGVNRVFRPPFGRNGKPQYGGWDVRAVEWRPERRFSVEEIAAAYGLELVRERRVARGATDSEARAMEAFVDVYEALDDAHMIKTREPDPSGWYHITCPWTEQHTGGVDNGAAIRFPHEENAWAGAFRCHHGHCEARGMRDLTDWLNEDIVVELERVNANAGHWEDYRSER